MTRHRPLLVLVILLAATSGLRAEAQVPRGPGLYLNLSSLGLAFAVYLAWIALCTWVDRDAHRVQLDRARWNGLMLASGVIGFALLWLIPWFLVAFVVLLILLAVPAGFYIRGRNAIVAAPQRVATAAHAKMLLKRFLGIDLGVSTEQATGPEVHFLPLANESPEMERLRVRRSQRLPGYAPALDLLADAIRRRATELYLDETRDHVSMLLKIDGVQQEGGALGRERADEVAAVFKTWAVLDGAAEQHRSEGAFAIELEGGRVDCRVRTTATAGRERVAIHLHDHTQRIVRLDQLGIPERLRTALLGTLALRSGLLLVCGPENSGRVTTGYGLLHALDRQRRSILTIETVPRHSHARFEHVQIQPDGGETFASTLRGIHAGSGRQVIFVGEIDDEDTADLACLKAEEGRLVIGVVRSLDALGGLFRLVELGVPTTRLADVLHGVVAQRLLRVLCTDCKVRYRPDLDAVRRANLSPERSRHFCRVPEETEHKRDPRGQLIVCPTCRGIGYRGRTGIFEYLQISARIRELLRDGAPINAVKQEAVKHGMHFLQDEALELVAAGATSVSEMIQGLKE